MDWTKNYSTLKKYFDHACAAELQSRGVLVVPQKSVFFESADSNQHKNWIKSLMTMLHVSPNTKEFDTTRF